MTAGASVVTSTNSSVMTAISTVSLTSFLQYSLLILKKQDVKTFNFIKY